MQVLPTEDSERHTVRQKFRQVVRLVFPLLVIVTQYLNYHQCSVLIVICALLHQVQQGGGGVHWGCPRHDEVRLVFEVFSILYLFAFLTCVQHSADLGLMTWRCFQLKRPLQILILTQASAPLRTLHFSGFTFL